jgi:hypothetical protein
MKKPTKSAKTPAPAIKTSAPAPATKTTAPAKAQKTTVAPKIKAPAAPAPLAPAPVAKPKGSSVTISAKYDVGFGNALFIRGGGAGLSWEKGTALENLSADVWTIVIPGVEKPFGFKFAINDEVWSAGEDFVASPGDTLTITPGF